MAFEEIDADVLEGLAAKIDGLNLSAQEDAVIKAVLDRAASVDTEVQGFGADFEIAPPFKVPTQLRLTDPAAGWGRALGVPIHRDSDRYIGETEKH